MLNKIIVPLDGSKLAERIVPYTGALARALDVPLELLYAVDPEALRVTREQEEQGIFVDKLEEHVGSWARAYLHGVAGSLNQQGVRPRIAVTVGVPEQAIVDAAGRNGRDLVAMATHGRTGLPRLVLGSVADKVLHLGHMPLLLLRPRQEKAPPPQPPRTLVVPLNFPGAEHALPMAGFLARNLGARVLLVRVLHPFALAIPQLVPASPVAGGEQPAIGEAEARAYLDEQVHSLYQKRIAAEGIVVSGDSGEELMELAAGAPEALVVMATHARAGIARMLLGSVAERVMRGLGTPVLILRPES